MKPNDYRGACRPDLYAFEVPDHRRYSWRVLCARYTFLGIAVMFVSACASQPSCRESGPCVTHMALTRPQAQRAALTRAEKAASDAIAAYDITRALSAARKCRSLAQSLHQIARAQACNMTIRLAASDLGDARALFGAVYWEQRFGSRHQRLEIGSSHIDVRRPATALPPVSVMFDGGNATLEYLHAVDIGSQTRDSAASAAHSVSGRPMVAARINGHDVVAEVDTGTSMPLTLDRSHARSLGATPLLSGIPGSPQLGDAASMARDNDYDLVRTFRFGTLVMHDVATAVVPDIPGSHGVVVGLPVLAKYAQVTFGKSKVRLETSTTPCPTPIPLSSQSTHTLSGALLFFRARVNGKIVSALFDTGSTVPLLGGPALLLDEPAGPLDTAGKVGRPTDP